MIVDYIQFKKSPIRSDIQLFMIHGNPRNISNEIEHDIIRSHKKLGFTRTNYVIDDDNQTSTIKNEYYEQSLFEEKKLITVNVVSSSVPKSMKKFLEEIDNTRQVNRIILKLDRQQSSFKKTNFYKSINQKSCIIEIYELKGQTLHQWVMNKCKLHNVNSDQKFINNLINSNVNNSLAISQKIYQKSLMKSSNDLTTTDSRYNEYDLSEMILKRDIDGFLEVSRYLQDTCVPLSYAIYIANSELEKIYSYKNFDNKPYIPSFLQTKYNQAIKRYSSQELLHALKNIINLDINAKYNSKKSNPWVSFNDLFSIMMNNNTQV